MSEQSAQRGPVTYDGEDALELLHLIDPSSVGFERVVKAMRQASAGAENAKKITRNYVRRHAQRSYMDPFAFDGDIDDWWDDTGPAETLVELAREQVEKLKSGLFDMETSDNHPATVQSFVEEYNEAIARIEEWIRKPREDILSRIEEEAARPPWPVKVVYEHKHGAKNASQFLAQRPAPIISSDGVLYSFEDNAWRPLPDIELESEIRRTDPGDVLDVQDVSKMAKAVHQAKATPVRPFGWLKPEGNEPPPEDLALFSNLLLDVSKGDEIPHDGRFFATGLPGYRLDPFAGCPTWKKWLDDTLDPSFHPTLQEWFGYCLTPDVRAHKFMVFEGVPRSGKSTAHSVLHALVGGQHAVSAMMPDLGSDFGIQNFLDKRLVIIPDAHDGLRQNRAAALERIKSITGGDEISVNRKNMEIVTARLKVRILITCNRLPKFIDESGALADRMLIVRFDRSFKGREDRSMTERLKGEMSGIANWALEGLHRLRKNRFAFTVGDAGRGAVENARRSESPALRFAEDRLDVTGDSNDFTPMTAIYAAYNEWASTEGLPRHEQRSQMDLAMDLKAALSDIEYKQRRLKQDDSGPGKPTWGLVGVSGVRFADAIDDAVQAPQGDE